MMPLPAGGMEPPGRYWAVLTISIGLAMGVIDGAIANVALPTIGKDLGVDPASTVWVVNAYQLAIASSLLPLAALGDSHGFRRVYLVGLAVFTVASAACSAADSLTTLAIARMVQGFGAAGMVSVNSALVRFIYPRGQLGRGIGYNAVIVAVASAAGPTVASGILSVGQWPWLFAVNVPLGLMALLLGWRALPQTPRSPAPFDFLSAGLCAVALGALILGIDGIGRGQAAGWAVGEFALAILAGVALVWRQTKIPVPLLPIDLLRIPIFALSLSTSVCAFAAQMLAYVSLPFLLEGQLGFTNVRTGLLMTAWPSAIIVVAPIAGRLADRYPAGLLGGIGLAVLAAGLGLLALMGVHLGVWDVAWRMAVCGIGFGLFQSPNNRAIIGSAPRHRSGGASGMLGTARLVGQTTGTALVALALARWSPDRGTTIALITGIGFALLASGVSLLRIGRGRPELN